MKIKSGKMKQKICLLFNNKRVIVIGCILALGITCLLAALAFFNINVKSRMGKVSAVFQIDNTNLYEEVIKEIRVAEEETTIQETTAEETTVQETTIEETTLQETTITEITAAEIETTQEWEDSEEFTEPEEDYLTGTWFTMTDEGFVFIDGSDINGDISNYEPDRGPDIPVYYKSKAAEEKAIEIINRIVTTDMSEYEKVLAIHDYLCLNVQYDYDNYLNNSIPHESYTAEGALLYQTAVCNGYTEAFIYLCYAAGIESEKVEGTSVNSIGNVGEHAWNQVRIDGEWFNIDVTWDDPVEVDDLSYYRYDYFLLTDAEIEKNHIPRTYSEQHSCTSVRFKDEIRKLKVIRDLGDNYTFVSSDEEAMRAVEQYMSQGIYEYQIVYDVKNIDEAEQDKIMQRWWTQIEEYRQEKYPEMKWNCPIGHIEDYLIYEMSLME